MPELFAAYVAFLIAIGVLVSIIRAKDAELIRRDNEATAREVLSEARHVQTISELRKDWTNRVDDLNLQLENANSERRKALELVYPELAEHPVMAAPAFPPGDEGMWLREQLRSEEGRNSPEVKQAIQKQYDNDGRRSNG